ncbi:MAG: SMC-Scp complex subunit ScpB, partial [Christensenellaceae bacterium]|nr:SMC-Scp complex subunit ScpB [Christensenellaceae bacterium]
FMAGDAVEASDIAAALEIETEQLDEIVTRMMEKRLQERSGLQIIKVGSKLQMCTNPEYTPYIEKVLAPVKKTRLSQSMLETLAIIAYKQPITRFEIEQIRGVKSSYSIAALIEKGLIQRAGRKKTLGNPMLYVTSDEFLRHIGLQSLDELPPLNHSEA